MKWMAVLGETQFGDSLNQWTDGFSRELRKLPQFRLSIIDTGQCIWMDHNRATVQYYACWDAEEIRDRASEPSKISQWRIINGADASLHCQNIVTSSIIISDNSVETDSIFHFWEAHDY